MREIACNPAASPVHAQGIEFARNSENARNTACLRGHTHFDANPSTQVVTTVASHSTTSRAEFSPVLNHGCFNAATACKHALIVRINKINAALKSVQTGTFSTSFSVKINSTKRAKPSAEFNWMQALHRAMSHIEQGPTHTHIMVH